MEMNVLIVLAHPEPQSFNGSLARVAEEAFVAGGSAVRISDLYAQQFMPDEHARHFTQRKNPARFDPQTEQRFNNQEGTLPVDVRREIDAVLWADFVIFQFPLWWFGVPAILKGWMDRVFAYGALYTGSRRFHTGVCQGRRAMLSVTAGSPAEACVHDGQEGDTRLILWPIHYALHYVGFTVLEPSLITGVHDGHLGDAAAAQDRHLDAQLRRYRQRLENLNDVPAIPFNSGDDWDEHRKLKLHAPVHSPFIRHQANLLLSELDATCSTPLDNEQSG
jgi:NAD(P)H dehydrogenase (quinone)